MNPDYGVWYGLAFFVTLFGGMSVFFGWQERVRRRRLRDANPPIAGSGARAMARTRRLIRPTWLLTASEEPVFSKLGGAPRLPMGFDWPVGVKGLRVFLAQVDLAELAERQGPDWLPVSGRLYVFYDPEQEGFADVVEVVYSQDVPILSASHGRASATSYPERQVTFEKRNSAPTLDWLGVDVTALDTDFEQFDAAVDALVNTPPHDATQHRIGGYPNEIQAECLRISCELLHRGLTYEQVTEALAPTVARASMQWRLLLQIDSDAGLKMNFGDGGRLYVFIREREARRGDFSKTVALSQTY